jgi:hypothetical protein
MAQNTIKGRITASTGDPEDLTAANVRTILGLAAVATSGSAADLSTGTLPAGRMPALTGDVTTSAGAVATTIANAAVTYAKMQNVSATSRVLGRKTAGAGSPEECTLSQVLDMIGSAADGDILYRTGGAWARLAIGSSTNVLTVTGGVPVWAAAAGGSTTPPTKQYLTSGSGATYTTPANCKKIIIQMIGAGGGGAAATTNAGATGGTTTFNSINAAGGGGGNPSDGLGGVGGTGGTGSASLRLPGSAGCSITAATTSSTGGAGAPGIFGTGAPRQGAATGGTAAGVAGGTNTGAGGSGGFATVSTQHGAGGGAGEFVEFSITTPSATYTYTVGTGGNGGAAGVQAGGNGGSGLIIVEEYY